VVPIIPTVLVLASRLTLESPRRIDLRDDEVTDWAVVGDLVISGRAEDFGIRYSVGVYNLFDWRYALPVNPFPGRNLTQQGRSFMAQLGLEI
jgi:outer membrane receptor protein involved in Fe transport